MICGCHRSLHQDTPLCIEHHFGKHAIACLVLAGYGNPYRCLREVVLRSPQGTRSISPSGEIATLESHCISQGSFLDNSGELSQIISSLLIKADTRHALRLSGVYQGCLCVAEPPQPCYAHGESRLRGWMTVQAAAPSNPVCFPKAAGSGKKHA